VDAQEELRQAVRRGAEFLDEEAQENERLVPRNWRQLVARHELNMGVGTNCVLGLIARNNLDGTTDDFESMADALGLCPYDYHGGQVVELGFLTPNDTANTYPPLTRAWREYLDECSETG
jgi:hypothetical protein